MEDSKQTIIEGSICTAFTVINKCDLEKTKAEGRLVAVSGKVCTPGIYEVPEGTTLNELIQMAGGISEKQQFKAAQLGVPFGGFLTSDDLGSEIDFSIFRKDTYKGVVILSSEDCIVQFAIYYLDYVLSMMRNGEYLDLIACKNDIERMSRIFDRISKGKATTRDVYLLRYIASNVKERVGQEHNFVLDIIEDVYEEIEHHMDTDTMLNIIFDNTPCGYILVNKDNVVTFANDYALSLFGYKHEEFIDSYCDLFSENGQDQIRKDCIRMQRNVPAGKRIFDLYQSELSDDLNTYKMYVILDRTEEVTMRSRLQRSYLRLVNILQDLLNNDIDGADMTSQEKLEEIKDKAEMLSHKYGL